MDTGEQAMSRNFKVAVKSMNEYFSEAEDVLRNADAGIMPEIPLERVYFNDVKTFLRYITPRRFELLERLHHAGPLSMRALAKLLVRHYKNVFDDVKLLEQIGLVEQTGEGLYRVPWDEVTASFKLAA
jgi:predicted transcriptional regulator